MAAKKKAGSRRSANAGNKVKATTPRPGPNPPPPPPPAGAVARVFAEPTFVPLQPNQFSTGNVEEYSASTAFDSLHGSLRNLPARDANAPDFMDLTDVVGAAAIQQITNTGQLVFHSVGDTGADKRYRVQDEADVAAAMGSDLKAASITERPAFFYHLGDVVYEFGQPECYYAQFYEPYCQYNAPIFAIPGNHDGMVWTDSQVSLKAFLDNFCTPAVEDADNASSLHRTTMNQPGVYFTLEAPFASIVGLYSNTSDKGSGVISTPDPVGPSSAVGQAQKAFLIREIKRLARARQAGRKKAFILAVHHPPYKGTDTSVQGFCKDLDDAFTQGGLWPDLVLSGHEHNYARYTRTVNNMQIPYLISGSGGYNLTPSAPASDPSAKVPPSLAQNNPELRSYIKRFGYMKIKVRSDKLAVIFNCTDPAYGHVADAIILDLNTHQITECAKGVEPL